MGHYDIKRGGYDVFFVTNAHLRHKVEEDALTNKTAREQAIEKIAQHLHNHHHRQDEHKPWNELTKEQCDFWIEEAEDLLFIFNFYDIFESLGYVQKDPGQPEWKDKPDSEGWWWFMGVRAGFILTEPEIIDLRIGWRNKEMLSLFRGTWQRAIVPEKE